MNMGFFKSWEEALRSDSEDKYRRMRESAIVEELRNLQEISGDPERIGALINYILNTKFDEGTFSEIERLVIQIGDLIRRGKDFDEVLNELENRLKR